MSIDTSTPPNDALTLLEQEWQALNKSMGYALAHDLRAPVRAIGGFSRLLREQLTQYTAYAQDKDAQHFMERIEVATQHLSRMIQALIELQELQQQVLQRRNIALAALCESLLNQVPAAFSTHVDIAPDLMLNADPRLLSEAINELIHNACRFSSEATSPTLHITAIRDATGLTLCIKDNGLGFDMQSVERLGIPFQHLHARPDLCGLGVGLARVRCIALRHRGVLEVSSRPGEGSEFRLRFMHTSADTAT